MFDRLLTLWLRWLSGPPCFQIYGRARSESEWRLIDVFATKRRNLNSRWPFWAGSCTTWTSHVIAVGWDFAECVVREQSCLLATREATVVVAGGRLRDPTRRCAADAPSLPSALEVMAHECGHTRQARRLGLFYMPLVGAVTLLREGEHWWNYFENDASSQGEFGGIAPDTVRSMLRSPDERP